MGIGEAYDRPAKLLIVNADDFGLCAGVNSGIVHAHRHGIVTSATMMANMPGFADAVAKARDNPGLAVGLHLNLTYGRPLSGRVPSLTDRTGAFVGSPRFVRERGESREIRAEFRAQAERFLAAGLRPSHLDTHHHLHGSERILDLVAELARALGVTIRCLDARTLAARGLAPCARFVRSIGRGKGAGRLLRILADLPAGLTEISCHPGFVDAELRSLSRLCEGRERELEVLIDPRVRAAVAANGITLTNYRALGAYY